MLELSDKDFKTAMVKILQYANINMPETDLKKTTTQSQSKEIKSQHKNRRYKEETNENFRIEKYNQN